MIVDFNVGAGALGKETFICGAFQSVFIMASDTTRPESSSPRPQRSSSRVPVLQQLLGGQPRVEPAQDEIKAI